MGQLGPSAWSLPLWTVADGAGEGDEGAVVVALLGHVPLQRPVVPYGVEAGPGDDHGLGAAVDPVGHIVVEVLGHDPDRHPFALRQVFSDPGGSYALLDREDEGHLLIELKGPGQIAMWPALQRYLHQLDFDIDQLAERWYPAGRASPIVVDPRISFGAPVIAGTRVETATIAELYQGDESVEELAWLYDLEPAQVQAAVEFENSLAA